MHLASRYNHKFIRMVEGEQSGGSAPHGQQPPTPKDVASQQGKRDDESNRAGGQKQLLSDLHDERKARQQLKAEVDQIKQSNAQQMAALADALGIKADDKGDESTVVKQLQDTVAAMQRESAANRVARKHGISDEGDMELILSARDEDQMERIAARLAPVKAPSGMRPDPSQGSHGEPHEPDPGPGVPRMAAAFDRNYSNR